MDRVVTIQSVTNTKDSYGSTTQPWSTFIAELCVERKDLSMRERLQASQVNPALSAVYYAQYGPASAITEKMRLVDGSQTYEILSVVELGRKEGLRLEVGTI